jgi:hypothetical protein
LFSAATMVGTVVLLDTLSAALPDVDLPDDKALTRS